MRIEDSLVRDFKDTIDRATSPATVETFYRELCEMDWSDQPVDWPYVLQKAYIHACLRHKGSIAKWLENLFKTLDPVAQIAYRHSFTYGRTLLAKG